MAKFDHFLIHGSDLTYYRTMLAMPMGGTQPTQHKLPALVSQLCSFLFVCAGHTATRRLWFAEVGDGRLLPIVRDHDLRGCD